MNNKMPNDPFLPDDLSQFGQGAYNFYASLKNAGFSEEQALDVTKTIVINMLVTAMKAAQLKPSSPGTIQGNFIRSWTYVAWR